MKNIIVALAVSTLMLFVLVTPCQAVHKATLEVKTEVVEPSAKSAKWNKKLQKWEKKIVKKLKRKNAQNADETIDFTDDVEKWKWFWIFGWAGGIALGIIGLIISVGFLGTIAGLAILFGTVSLVIWLVNKYG